MICAQARARFAPASLKERGYKVMIYPFILMDIPEGNSLPDPYGGAEQSKFPWRGRITCHPAAGQDDTADQTDAAASQVEAFFGSAMPGDFGKDGDAVTYSGNDTGLRRFILHYAKLAQIAGGVERFVICSEMVGLTTIRSTRTDYPATEKLRALLSVGIDAYFPLSDWRETEPLDGEAAESIYDIDYLSANVRGGEGFEFYYE